ncbi:MAG: TetR/AcrR family transcriptional regulator, partial [Bacteroides sp.]|nr:TetR/AcrR family transcriptional regulator [Bacteroides sp.]
MKNAYRLFCELNYEKVTVPELEQATGISRGGIFHHTGNKQKLFIQVVDKYILGVHDPDTLFPLSTESTLIDFIHQYIT